MIEIKNAQEEDIPDMVQISKSSLPEPWSEQDFAGSMKLPYALLLVAKEDKSGKVFGYMVFHRGGDMGELVSIAVAKECRRRQIGSALMEHLVAYAQDKDLQSITLEVREGNRAAVELYQAQHFRTVGIRHKFYRNPTENALILGRDFR